MSQPGSNNPNGPQFPGQFNPLVFAQPNLNLNSQQMPPGMMMYPGMPIPPAGMVFPQPMPFIQPVAVAPIVQEKATTTATSGKVRCASRDVLTQIGSRRLDRIY